MYTRKIKITETDKSYLESLKAHLKAVAAARETSDPTVLEVPADAMTDFHGVEEFRDGAPSGSSDLEACRAWLEAYTGDFEFYLSVRAQLRAKGSLSPKQIDAIKRAIDRDKAPAKAAQVLTNAGASTPVIAPVAKPRDFSLNVGEILVVRKFLAEKLARAAGYIRPHYQIEITAVHNETAKAWLVDLRLSAQRTSSCSVCGAYLTNPESVEAGIGPICAGRSSVEFSREGFEALVEAIRNTVQVKQVWLPKSGVKEREKNGTEKNDGWEQEIDGTVLGTGA